MSCNLDKTWNEAEKALRAMFEAGFYHEGEIPERYQIDFRDHITDIYHMYENVKRINKSRKDQWVDAEGNPAPATTSSKCSDVHQDTVFVTGADDGVITLPDGCYDPDGNISIDTGNITLGDAIASVPDAISWNNEVFTSPEITFGTDTQAAPPQASQSGELPPIDPEKNAEDLNNRDGD
tara:strand:- start:50 stop:589 length:540 start_codon:yes stop_codon:yes gene_type:complete